MFFKIIRAIFRYPLILIFGIHFHGRENVPKDGGFLICANHTSMADVIPIALGIRPQPRFMAKKEALSVPVVGAFLRSLGAFSVDRGSSDVGAVRKAIGIIREKGVVSIFPQGHRYPKVAARSTPLHSGAALIAYRAGCDVVPVYIKSRSGQLKAFRRNDIYFGEPIENSVLGFEAGGSAEYKRASAIIFDRVCDMGVEAGAPLEVAAAAALGEDAVTHSDGDAFVEDARTIEPADAAAEAPDGERA